MLDTNLKTRFCAARRRAIALDFAALNPPQQEGVLTTEGPLLLLAGAGSGKTTVLIHRIANLLRYGRGSDSAFVPDWVTEADLAYLEDYDGSRREERVRKLCAVEPVRPWQVIAITFTNKAAGELKDRLEREIGVDARDVWAATFHSACVRILRRKIETLGFPSSFTIYDTDDSIRVMKDCIKEAGLDEKMFPPRSVLGQISRAKDEMLLAADYEVKNRGNFRLSKIAALYMAYEKKLRSAGALDFDDIILHTVRLLQENAEVRAYYQNQFQYVLIDEYQDTNHLQYLLATLLAGGRKNLCVVGDDDQSIYRFRGATIENILSFEQQYQQARVIRLEQNYRSTGHILDASNAVIRNNLGRKGKKLWTKRDQGEPIQQYTAHNERDEALYVAAQMLKHYGEGRQWKEQAVLYRMNALSNQVEIALKSNGIPYKVIGGFRFFERSEVKDMLAYLCTIHNPEDDLRLLRIVNVPPRGLGSKTLDTARETAQQEGLPLWSILRQAERYPALQKAAPKFRKFVELIEKLQLLMETEPLVDCYELLLKESGYAAMLEEKKTMENRARLENVRELKTSINSYLEHDEIPTLGGFLDEVALYTDLDQTDEQDNCVTLMTMHAAKGLEFPIVFAVGMEEGIFPGYRAIGEADELEEERRLCYVAMTRAKEVLHLSCSGQRMLFGRTTSNPPSRFLEEIPMEYVESSGKLRAMPQDVPPWETAPQAVPELPVRRPVPSAPPRSPQRPAPAKPATQIRFSKGELVRHDSFGPGMVLSVQPMGGDALLEVAFDKVGTKRLMWKAAVLHMHQA